MTNSTGLHLTIPQPRHASTPNSAASSPCSSVATNIGRPPLWTPSCLRKAARLYLYTTLPAEKLPQVVFARSLDNVPGKDSVSKKLNFLFDKQMRWLHPKDERDMIKRLDELSYSAARAPPCSDPSHHHGRRHATSDPMGQIREAQSGFNPGSWSQEPAPVDSDAAFGKFIRRSTCMSSSSESSTGTLQDILPQYSPRYRKVVSKLMKRYTGLHDDQLNSPLPLSPYSDTYTEQPSWTEDPHSASQQLNGPFPLPGDFLSISDPQAFSMCFIEPHRHTSRSCLCHAARDISTSPWAVAGELGPAARSLSTFGPTISDLDERDAFDNTVFHYLAAKGSVQCLFSTMDLAILQGKPVWEKQNSAGQTFLHLLHQEWFHCGPQLMTLLQCLQRQGFDFGAFDCYGRTFFHVLLEKAPQLCDYILRLSPREVYNRRDAFGVIPEFSASQSPMDQMDMDIVEENPAEPSSYHTEKVSEATSFLRLVGEASNGNPTLEDSKGRNGLHCLARAVLNLEDVSRPSDSLSAAPMSRRTSRGSPSSADSGTEKLSLRQGLLHDLLERKVDPNHYDKDGNTPLMAFVAHLPEDDDYKKGPEILCALIRAGAMINARNRAGETALHIAVRTGRKLAARTLIKEGANVHVRDAEGRSLLDVADVKITKRPDDPKEYAHYEACRAYLSGNQGSAKQEPTILEEWGSVEPATSPCGLMIR